MKTITILIAPDGGATVETKGFAGQTCQGASAFLEQALGQVAADQRTAEFYTRQRQSQPAREQR